jgi:hypothetical protein
MKKEEFDFIAATFFQHLADVDIEEHADVRGLDDLGGIAEALKRTLGVEEEKEMPFVAYGNGEINSWSERVGDTATCPNCGKAHEVKYGEKVNADSTRQPSKMLAFVSCGEKSFLVGIQGKVIER